MFAKLPDDLKSLPEVSEFLKSFGRTIALSKMCGVDTESAGEMIAMEVLLTGRTPREIGLEMSGRYNMMHGKLAIKSEAILADFHKAGGASKIIERSEWLAKIELTYRGETKAFSVSWDEIQNEPYVYEGKEKDVIAKLANSRKGLTVKAKYATPRSRMQMLWSRVISDAVRAIAPEVTRGAYTPEELADVVESETGTIVEPKPKAEETKAKSVEPKAKPAELKTQSDETQYATADQSSAIKELFIRLVIGHERQQEILAKRNVQAVRSLTQEQAELLIQNLRQIEKQRQQNAAENDTSTSHSTEGPATEDQVAEIKAAISAAQQSGMKGLASEIKQHLVAFGLNTLSDLSFDDAREMVKAIEARSMAAFFEKSLTQFDEDGNEIPF